jgi:transposase
MESGQTKSASLSNGLLLARALGVSPAHLAGLPEAPPLSQALALSASAIVIEATPPGDALPEPIEAALASLKADLLRKLAATEKDLADLSVRVDQLQPPGDPHVRAPKRKSS